ncbi:MAG: hypothetical protein MZU84_04420 [Sphingobacterium sp.]|nr:hypothetical protein [Sphingobacterium sp.]
MRAGKERGVRVTCEVAPHHFTLSDERLLAPARLRHQPQDEPAAARREPTATRSSRASGTARWT